MVKETKLHTAGETNLGPSHLSFLTMYFYLCSRHQSYLRESEHDTMETSLKQTSVCLYLRGTEHFHPVLYLLPSLPFVNVTELVHLLGSWLVKQPKIHGSKSVNWSTEPNLKPWYLSAQPVLTITRFPTNQQHEDTMDSSTNRTYIDEAVCYTY